MELNPTEKAEVKAEKLTVEQALPILWGIMGEVYTVGSNDIEIPQILSIIEGCQKGKIEPQDAVEQGRAILSHKQDYH